MNTTTTTPSIATIIWNQIPVSMKMAYGMRNPVSSGSKLTIKVGGRMTWIEVTLTSDDLYTVERIRINRKHERIVEETLSGVYNDMLNDVINVFCNK